MNRGQPLRLTVSDGETSVTVTGEAAQTPVTRALSREEIVRSLTKLGDSPFLPQGEPAVETDGAIKSLETCTEWQTGQERKPRCN